MKSKKVCRIKFGLSRIVALFVAAAMLTLGVASCSSDSGDGGDEAKTYFVKVENAGHGTVVASAEKAETGKTITLEAKADEGYVFEAYSVKDADGKAVEVKNGAFKMPASDVIVSVSFKKEEKAPDTPSDNPQNPEEKPDTPTDNSQNPEEKPDTPTDNPQTPEDKPDTPATVEKFTVTIAPASTIGVDKSVSDGAITLTADSGFTGYTWLIDGTAAAGMTGATVSEDGTKLTLAKANLTKDAVYQVSLSATKDGIPYGAQITVKKEPTRN